MRTEIQLDMFWVVFPLTDEGGQLHLMRLHKSAQGVPVEVPLVTIELRPYESGWMWACYLDSARGARALPKTGEKLVSSKLGAVHSVVDEVRQLMRFATAAEQHRIKPWLGYLLSSALNDLRNDSHGVHGPAWFRHTEGYDSRSITNEPTYVDAMLERVKPALVLSITNLRSYADLY
jgi:hypothetical protein